VNLARSCHRKATVAVARKLAVIMHAMWTDGTCYVGDGGSACWAPRHERAPDTFSAAVDHADGRLLNDGVPLRR
jgi:hypothetical protein